MEARFWHQRWEQNDIAFHLGEAHPLLREYFSGLSLERGSRVFLPLCGKTRDIPWLLSKGYRVAGAELSRIAVEQLFAELGLKPEVSAVGKMERYSAKNIDVYVGDIFDLSSEMLGLVDAIYDRAALVALPANVRNRYTTHLMEMTNKASQLLICHEYDQSLMEGPPFSISNDEIHRHYGESYDLSLLESADIPGGLKGKCAAKETVWMLRKNG